MASLLPLRHGSATKFVAVAAALAALMALPDAADAGADPQIHDLDAPGAVAKYAKFESTAAITPIAANPYDPAHIDVRGHFRAPDGEEFWIPGFWFQDYTRELVDGPEVLTASGAPVWKVRFSFPRPGDWAWWWTVKTPTGATTSPTRQVTVRDNDAPGFIRPSPRDRRYLAYDDGTPYFAVGENVGWYDARGTFAYDAWYRRLARQGANYSRLWMPSWAFGLEWNDTGLGDYTTRLDRAWQLDYVLDLGARHGISTMLSLQNHGAFSLAFNSEWAANPYNAANGGPLDLPGEIYTDAAAKDFFQRRLRYVVARWGYSTNVLAWELWNEADLVTPYLPSAALAWHRDMGEFLRAVDPHDHMVSTSFALGPSDASVWAAAGLDFTQFHFYSRSNDDKVALFPNIAQDMTTWMPAQQAAYQRPTLFAEFGVDSRGPVETFRGDPAGFGLHDGLWAGALSGAFGTGMTWWWDNFVDVIPDRFYPMFGSIAGFVEGVGWDREGFLRTTSVASSVQRPLVVYGLQGRRTALLWVKNDAHQWNSPDESTISDARLTLTGLSRGQWCGTWWDTWAGAATSDVSFNASVLPTTLDVPDFERDVALRLERCPGELGLSTVR